MKYGWMVLLVAARTPQRGRRRQQQLSFLELGRPWDVVPPTSVKVVETIEDVPSAFNLDVNPPPRRVPAGGAAPEESVGHISSEAAKVLAQPLGGDGSVAAALVGNVVSDLERRRRDKLRAQGIYSDRSNAQNTSPLGLPCNPYTNPLLCGNLTDITDPSKPADELRRERRERKEERQTVKAYNRQYSELMGAAAPSGRRERRRREHALVNDVAATGLPDLSGELFSADDW